MKRVLVTGAGGFIGSAIHRRLAERADIVAIASGRSDLRDRAAIDAALSSWTPDIIVHAAGRTHGDAAQLHADNVVLTRQLAEASGAGSIDVQLVYFRGFDECRASAWVRDSATMLRLMSRIYCRAYANLAWGWVHGG